VTRRPREGRAREKARAERRRLISQSARGGFRCATRHGQRADRGGGHAGLSWICSARSSVCVPDTARSSRSTRTRALGPGQSAVASSATRRGGCVSSNRVSMCSFACCTSVLFLTTCDHGNARLKLSRAAGLVATSSIGPPTTRGVAVRNTGVSRESPNPAGSDSNDLARGVVFSGAVAGAPSGCLGCAASSRSAASGRPRRRRVRAARSVQPFRLLAARSRGRSASGGRLSSSVAKRLTPTHYALAGVDRSCSDNGRRAISRCVVALDGVTIRPTRRSCGSSSYAARLDARRSIALDKYLAAAAGRRCSPRPSRARSPVRSQRESTAPRSAEAKRAGMSCVFGDLGATGTRRAPRSSGGRCC